MIAMIIMVTDVDASKSQRHNILRVWCFACFVLFVCNRKEHQHQHTQRLLYYCSAYRIINLYIGVFKVDNTAWYRFAKAQAPSQSKNSRFLRLVQSAWLLTNEPTTIILLSSRQPPRQYLVSTLLPSTHSYCYLYCQLLCFLLSSARYDKSRWSRILNATK